MKKKNWEGIKKIAIYTLCGVVLFTGYLGKSYYIHKSYQEDLANKILRFHVLANSDSTEDQNLKLHVRDAVGAYMSPLMKQANDREECERIVEENLNGIIETAEQEIEKRGYHYEVTANLGQTRFPVKTYGCYTFPSGTYEALNVVIGNGKGHNWWCVMYPNMCFSGSVYTVIDEQTKESLQQVLTKDEYETLMEEKDYEIQCKYLTFLNPLLDEVQ